MKKDITKVSKVKGKSNKSELKSTTKKLSPKQKKQSLFLKSYFDTLGNISEACKKIKIGRTTYYDWMTEEQFKSKFNDITEAFDDGIETTIRALATSGDKDLLKFWASRKMKKRGFTEKTEIEYSGQSSIKGTIEIIIPNETTNKTDNQAGSSMDKTTG